MDCNNYVVYGGPCAQYGRDFPEEIQENLNSGKTPETLSERFLEFSSRVRLESPKPCNSRHLRIPEHFQNSLPLSTAGPASFCQKRFRRGPLRAGHGIPSSTEGISGMAHSPKPPFTNCPCAPSRLFEAAHLQPLFSSGAGFGVLSVGCGV